MTEFRELLLERREVILGIRPEHVSVGLKPSAAYAFQGEVYVVEPLGDQAILDFKIGGSIVRATVPPDFRADVGDRLWLSFSKENFHIIDKKTEEVIL